jgi:hypothetical protein
MGGLRAGVILIGAARAKSRTERKALYLEADAKKPPDGREQTDAPDGATGKPVVEAVVIH